MIGIPVRTAASSWLMEEVKVKNEQGVNRNHSVKRQICPGVWFCPVCSQQHWEVERDA